MKLFFITSAICACIITLPCLCAAIQSPFISSDVACARIAYTFATAFMVTLTLLLAALELALMHAKHLIVSFLDGV